MREWFNRQSWKDCVLERVPRVRIPFSPPMHKTFIIFVVASLAWCLVLGVFVYMQIFAMAPLFNVPNISASVILADNQPIVVSTTTSAPTPVTILAFGDMMLDRQVREKIIQNGQEFPFVLIKDFLQGDGTPNDVVVANAEGPFTTRSSVTMGIKDGPLQFTFDSAMLSTLKNLGFTLLGQANNHALNFGLAGYSQSTTSIAAAGLNWFGDPRNIDVAPYVADVRGEKIAFIGYHQFVNWGLNNVLQAIKEAKQSDSFVVVYPHWGVEYNLGFTPLQQKVAHELVDAGADVVFGAHPHVIEPIEMYKGKPIFYSLGNFIFDQASSGPTAQGLSVKVSLTPDQAKYDLFPISILNEQASPMSTGDEQTIFDRLNISNGQIIVPRQTQSVLLK